MRNRRILRILPILGVGVLLLPIASWAAGSLQPQSDGAPAALAVQPASVVAPVVSIPGSLEEDRLGAEARQEAAAAALTARQAERAAAAEQAAAKRAAVAAKRAEAERARRERASRGGGRSRPAPLVIAGAPDDVWARLRRCEAGGDYRRNSGNGYYGAYQFAAATWRSLGYPGLPHQAPPEVQDEAAQKLQRRSGWGQWPACSRRIGVR